MASCRAMFAGKVTDPPPPPDMITSRPTCCHEDFEVVGNLKRIAGGREQMALFKILGDSMGNLSVSPLNFQVKPS